MTSNAVPRLAIVRQKYNPAGGAERFVSRAVGALRDAGEVDVVLIARRWESLAGLTPCLVNPFFLGNVWRDWGFARAARRAWKSMGISLVQSHERIPGCSIYRAGDGLHARWLEIRRQGLGFWGRLSLWCNPYHHYTLAAERAMFTHPDLQLVICNSRMVKNEIRSAFGLPEESFAVIHNGLDTEKFSLALRERYRESMRRALTIPQNAPVLLHVGSGFERKGLKASLAAVRANPDVWLVVVGRDKNDRDYKAMARRYGIADRVYFAGAQDDVLPFYGMADALVLTSLYDPFPNVGIEALASGLPVFTSPTCGTAELIQNGNNGWVVESAQDVSGLSHAVAEWMADRRRWPELRIAARRSVEHMTLEAMASELLGCYQRILASSARKVK